MVLPVVKFGTPVLRQKGARIEAITPTIKKLIADMLETMYAHKGVGLAAQQVGLALQLTVIDVRGVTDRPSSLEVAGQPVDVAEFVRPDTRGVPFVSHRARRSASAGQEARHATLRDTESRDRAGRSATRA